MLHTGIINKIIEKKGYTSYLEIGVHVPAHNFDLIKCKFKIGVDPNGAANYTGTSDEFFKVNKQEFDIVFIDGLHHAEQVREDFINSINCLNEEGLILLHDTNPAEERFTHVPRVARGRWNGDVYRFMYSLSQYDYRTLTSDPNGLTVVKNGPEYLPGELGFIDFEVFTKNKNNILRLCNDEEFKEWL